MAIARCRVPDCDWNLHSEAHDIIDSAAEDHVREHDDRAGMTSDARTR